MCRKRPVKELVGASKHWVKRLYLLFKTYDGEAVFSKERIHTHTGKMNRISFRLGGYQPALAFFVTLTSYPDLSERSPSSLLTTLAPLGPKRPQLFGFAPGLFLEGIPLATGEASGLLAARQAMPMDFAAGVDEQRGLERPSAMDAGSEMRLHVGRCLER